MTRFYVCTNKNCPRRGWHVSHANVMRDPRDVFPRCPGCSLVSHMSRVQTPQERAADERAYADFLKLQKFVAACRRQWGRGTQIVLRPNEPQQSSGGSKNCSSQAMQSKASNGVPQMGTVDDYYPSKYLKSEDLDGEDVVVTIERVGEDLFEDDEGRKRPKPILHFREDVKPLIVNKTNFKKIAEVAGKDHNTWPPATRLILFPDKLPNGNDTIKVRIPPKPKAKTAPAKPMPKPDPDWSNEGDDLPTANPGFEEDAA
jgi:hypothetical protein